MKVVLRKLAKWILLIVKFFYSKKISGMYNGFITLIRSTWYSFDIAPNW